MKRICVGQSQRSASQALNEAVLVQKSMAEEVITFEGEILRWEVEEKDRLKRDRRQIDATRRDMTEINMFWEISYCTLDYRF